MDTALVSQWPPKQDRSRLRVLRRGHRMDADEQRVVASTVLPPGDRAVVLRGPAALKDVMRAKLLELNKQMVVATSLKNYGEMICLFDQKMHLKSVVA